VRTQGPDAGGPSRRARPAGFTRRRNGWLLAGAVAGAATVLATGVVLGSHLGAHHTRRSAGAPAPQASVTSSSAAGVAALTADFTHLEAGLHAVAGIAVAPVGSPQTALTFGDWRSGPAWSTIKVPLVIAALREQHAVTGEMSAAITESDNAAAESIWAKLGDPVTAAHRVEAVLRQTGDPTTVQWQKVRPEFTAFGQTDWPLTDQVRFTAAASCDSADAPIFALMGQIAPDQRWGIGTVSGARFKGGWGPSPTGAYLVRQLGVLAGPNGMVAVALAAAPASGHFDDGAADLTEMTTWLTAHLGALPAGRCGG